MNYEVIVPEEVWAELESATEWYRRRSLSVEVANQWLHGFQDAIGSLATNPDRCAIAHESVHLPYELRELLYGSGRRKTHRAIFRIVGDRVVIMAIRHVAQRDFTPDDL